MFFIAFIIICNYTFICLTMINVLLLQFHKGRDHIVFTTLYLAPTIETGT